jgi:hypothetical protein
MIKRYNKQVYFPLKDKQALINAIESLNVKQWKILFHAKLRLQEKFKNDVKLLMFINELKLNYNNLFEYYVINGKLEKFCFELVYNGKKLALVLTSEKEIVTLWENSILDFHNTIDFSLYCKE